MKLLIAFALFAVAFAAEQVQVVNLPEARAPFLEKVDFRPLMVPQAVIDALKAAHSKLDADIDGALRVKVVDAPLKKNVKAIVLEPIKIAELAAEVINDVADESLKVKFVDAPLQAEAFVPEPIVEQEESLKVRIAEAPVLEAAAHFDEDESLKVRIVDAPVHAEDVLKVIKPVVLGRAPAPEYEVPSITAARYPGKVYSDPRLRYKVPSFDAPRFPGKVFSDPRMR